jgi:hypothetical protein
LTSDGGVASGVVSGIPIVPRNRTTEFHDAGVSPTKPPVLSIITVQFGLGEGGAFTSVRLAA